MYGAAYTLIHMWSHPTMLTQKFTFISCPPPQIPSPLPPSPPSCRMNWHDKNLVVLFSVAFYCFPLCVFFFPLLQCICDALVNISLGSIFFFLGNPAAAGFLSFSLGFVASVCVVFVLFFVAFHFGCWIDLSGLFLCCFLFFSFFCFLVFFSFRLCFFPSFPRVPPNPPIVCHSSSKQGYIHIQALPYVFCLILWRMDILVVWKFGGPPPPPPPPSPSHHVIHPNTPHYHNKLFLRPPIPSILDSNTGK